VLPVKEREITWRSKREIVGTRARARERESEREREGARERERERERGSEGARERERERGSEGARERESERERARERSAPEHVSELKHLDMCNVTLSFCTANKLIKASATRGIIPVLLLA
jgi:hypothetical protein